MGDKTFKGLLNKAGQWEKALLSGQSLDNDGPLLYGSEMAFEVIEFSAKLSFAVAQERVWKLETKNGMPDGIPKVTKILLNGILRDTVAYEDLAVKFGLDYLAYLVTFCAEGMRSFDDWRPLAQSGGVVRERALDFRGRKTQYEAFYRLEEGGRKLQDCVARLCSALLKEDQISQTSAREVKAVQNICGKSVLFDVETALSYLPAIRPSNRRMRYSTRKLAGRDEGDRADMDDSESSKSSPGEVATPKPKKAPPSTKSVAPIIPDKLEDFKPAAQTRDKSKATGTAAKRKKAAAAAKAKKEAEASKRQKLTKAAENKAQGIEPIVLPPVGGFSTPPDKQDPLTLVPGSVKANSVPFDPTRPACLIFAGNTDLAYGISHPYSTVQVNTDLVPPGVFKLPATAFMPVVSSISTGAETPLHSNETPASMRQTTQRTAAVAATRNIAGVIDLENLTNNQAGLNSTVVTRLRSKQTSPNRSVTGAGTVSENK